MRRLAPLLLSLAVATADAPTYELPANPKTPVLTIDQRGGYTAPRKNNDPYLAILADGTIVGEHVKPGTKLTAAELQELLRFVIDKHKLMEFNRQAVEAKARGDAYITDQSDTIVTIAIKGRTRKVTYNASTWAAQQWPAVRELQDLEAVRKRLHSIWCVAQLGKAEAKRSLDLANAELRKRHPKVAALTMQDLNWVYRSKDGLVRVQIARWEAKESVAAYVNRPKQGPATAEVSVQPR
jgi:hypothetical protein